MTIDYDQSSAFDVEKETDDRLPIECRSAFEWILPLGFHLGSIGVPFEFHWIHTDSILTSAKPSSLELRLPYHPIALSTIIPVPLISWPLGIESLILCWSGSSSRSLWFCNIGFAQSYSRRTKLDPSCYFFHMVFNNPISWHNLKWSRLHSRWVEW